MHDSYKQVIPGVCLCLIIGACSSSNEVAPMTTSGNGIDASTAIDDETSAVVDGSASATELVIAGGDIDGAGGDTAGTVIDGVGTTGGGVDIVGAASVPAMQGEWVTSCLESGSFFRRQTLSVIGSRMLTELAVFSDQSCTMPVSLGEVINGSTVQRNATIVPTGATREVSLGDAIEVNFHFEEGTVDNRPLTASDFPGRDDFIEKIEYDIVFVQGDFLYLGDSTLEGYAGTSAQKRPVLLNTLYIYNRIP